MDEDGSLWLTHNSKVSHIDTSTSQVTRVVDIGAEVGQLLAFDEGVWVAGASTITRIDVAR